MFAAADRTFSSRTRPASSVLRYKHALDQLIPITRESAQRIKVLFIFVLLYAVKRTFCARPIALNKIKHKNRAQTTQRAISRAQMFFLLITKQNYHIRFWFVCISVYIFSSRFLYDIMHAQVQCVHFLCATTNIDQRANAI